MDEDDWEELDENAMEECMILATQLCTQQQQQQQHTNTHTDRPKTQVGERDGKCNFTMNGSSGVRDSGVSSTRGSGRHHSSVNGTASKTEVPNYRSRFSDFTTVSSNSVPKRVKGYGGSGSRSEAGAAAAGVAVGGSSEKSKGKEEDKLGLNEKILVMQGEISLLRAELKRKDTVLETERLDHCAAIEVAEKRGREKIAKQAADTETKLKEKSAKLDKIEGELHFKKREIEELLHRCHQLEEQHQQSPKGTTTTTSHLSPPGKRARLENYNNNNNNNKKDIDIAKRFDFSCYPSVNKVCVEIQTEESLIKKATPTRTRLNVASKRGQVSTTRSIATLLSMNNMTISQQQQQQPPDTTNIHTQPQPQPSTQLPPHTTTTTTTTTTTPPTTPLKSRSMPSDLLSVVSQVLRESEDPNKLVDMCTDKLKQTHQQLLQQQTTTTTTTADTHNSSLTGGDGGDVTLWYENEVMSAVHMISFFKSSSSSNVTSTLMALTHHIKPIYVKGVMVNVRTRHTILEAFEAVCSGVVKQTIDKKDSELLVSSLREYCMGVSEGSEAEALIKAGTALSRHCKLCLSKDLCLLSPLCKKVKKLCQPSLPLLQSLLDLTYALVKVSSPKQWLSSRCLCPSHLLGTFIWHLYQTLDTATNEGNKSKVYSVLCSCVQVLHYWSTVDGDWWDRVSSLPQYTTLMAFIAKNNAQINFNRETVEMVCDLYEFEDGIFNKR